MFGASRPVDTEESRNDKANGGGSRRRHPRFSSLGKVFASIGGGREGSVLNVSLGGILLRLKWVLNLGSSYFVKLFVDGKVAVVEARVVRLVTRKDDCLAGMEFLHLPSRDRKTLQRFLEHR